MSQNYSIGIDLGATNSSIGVWINDKVEIIQNELGSRQTPSCVAFTEQGILIGDIALDQIHRNPHNTIFDVKMLMGRQYSDNNFLNLIKVLPFKVEPGFNDKPMIVVINEKKVQKLFPEEICSMILENLKKRAEIYLGQPVSLAVISVPAYFNDLQLFSKYFSKIYLFIQINLKINKSFNLLNSFDFIFSPKSIQRSAIREAGSRIGLNILRIINEPSAAAIAYNFDKINKFEQQVLIVDLGSKKLDLTLLLIEDGIIEVKGNFINDKLGGFQFDAKLVEYCCTQFQNQKGINIRNDSNLLQKLRLQCEKAKKVLSYTHQTTIDIDNFHNNEDFICTITRANFEMLCMNLFEQCILSIDKILVNLNLIKNEINEVVLVGGSAKIPKVQQMLKDYFNGKQLNQSINPEEVITFGVATQAAIFSGQLQQKIEFGCIFDVTILNLGIETYGGLITTLIARNSTIPTKKTRIFTTKNDYQTEVQIKIYLGFKCFAKDCVLIDQFYLTGISPAIRGVPEILITSEIDNDHTLTITAQDLTSKNSNNIIIANLFNGLTKDYIEKHILEAEKFEDQDKIKQTRIQAKNNLESKIYLIRNIINSEKFKLKLSSFEKQKHQLLVNETLQWITKNPNIEIQDYQDKFQTLEEVQQNLYQLICLDDNDSQQARAWFERSSNFSLDIDQVDLNKLNQNQFN